MQTTSGTKDVKGHDHSKTRTIAVTKVVLRKNHRKQTRKQLPVLWMSNDMDTAKKEQKPLLRLSYIRTIENKHANNFWY